MLKDRGTLQTLLDVNGLEIRQNRNVNEDPDGDNDFPSFSDFAVFLAMEAEVTCNPVTCIHAF